MYGHLIAKLHLRQTSCIWNKRKKRTLRLYITNVLEKYKYVYKRFFKFLEVKYFFLIYNTILNITQKNFTYKDGDIVSGT